MPALSSFPPTLQALLIRLYRQAIRHAALRRLISILHPELGSTASFVAFAGTEVSAGARVLDAGAGSQVYRGLFAHCRYEATDLCAVDKIYLARPDFVCDLNRPIPARDGAYDAVLNIQVLEHVAEPQLAVSEFHRVLRQGGKLFLVAPQGWGLHDEPHHYFNFTRYGLALLFARAGFRVRFIDERGGYFRYLAVRLQEMPRLFLRSSRHPLKFVVALPLALITALLFFGVTPPLLCLADALFDRERKFTLGYACYCVKE